MGGQAGESRDVARHENQHRRSRVAVTLAAAAVLAACLGARAAIVLGSAGDDLQSAVRTDLKRDAAIVEDVRFVYQDEAPQAFRYAKAVILAQEMIRAATGQSGLVRAALLVDAGTQTQIAQTFLKGSAIASNSRYLINGSFSVGRRLGDIRRKYPALVALDPAEKYRAGSRAAWHGNLDAATTLGPALAFLLAACGEAFAARRRLFLTAAWVFILAALAAGIAWELVLP